jgi:hypothetical protein
MYHDLPAAVRMLSARRLMTCRQEHESGRRAVVEGFRWVAGLAFSAPEMIRSFSTTAARPKPVRFGGAAIAPLRKQLDSGTH